MKYQIGDSVGRIKIIAYAGVDHANKMLVLCKCNCGKEFVTRQNNIGRKTNSCGCLKADLIKQRMGKPIEDVAARHILNACKRNAPTSITQDTVKKLIFSNCFYCESSPDTVGTTWKRGISDGRSVKRIGIDRIDPSKGYEDGNIVPCCQVCNYIKRDHSPQDLLIRLQSFIKNLGKLC